MRALKIAQVATSDASIRLLLLDHIEALAAAGHEVTAVCAPGQWTEDLRTRGITVAAVPMNREMTPLADLQALGGLTRLFRNKKFDVVHTHTPKAGLLGPLAARLAGVPVVVHTIHGLLFHDRMPAAAQCLFWLPEKFTAALAHRLLICGAAPGMLGIEAVDQAIEEPSPRPRPLEKQPVHRRRQPQHAQPLAERRLAAHRLTDDPHDPPLMN